MIICIYCGVLTDGTPFSSAHAYKTKGGGGGEFFLIWDSKKAKGYKDQVPWPGTKKHPTYIIKENIFLFIIIIIDLKYDIFPYMRKYLYL